MNFSTRSFLEGVGVGLLLLCSSFIAYFIPPSSYVIFFLLLVVFTVLSYKNLTLGILFIFAELSLGGHGYMIRLPLAFGYLSLRHVWFFVLLTIFLIKHHRAVRILWRTRTLTLDLIIGALFVTFYGVVIGILRGNSIEEVFFDANAFMFLLVFFPVVYLALNTSEFLRRLTPFVLGCFFILSSMTLVTFFIFSNGISIAPSWYLWVRDVRMGEVTDVRGLYRVFFQSHIFLLIAIVVFGMLSLTTRYPLIDRMKSHYGTMLLFGLAVLFVGSLLVGMSRSFALGFFAGMGAVLGAAVILGRLSRRDVLRLLMHGTFVFLSALTLVGILSGSFFDVTHFSDRLRFTGEPGVDSRWALLTPLKEEIKKNPIFGKGFGTNVWFTTRDPRIIEATKGTGEYQTYSFEWGFLDLWLKTGFFGLLVWLFLLFSIVRSAFSLLKKGGAEREALSAIGIVVTIAVVHFFTPYLNHPLGIGAISLASAMIVRGRGEENKYS